MFNSLILLFARFLGLFVLSPLFSQKGIPQMVRWSLAIACSLLLAPPLSALQPIKIAQPWDLLLQALPQILIGYFIGFLLSLLFEAAAFAGQLIGTAMGFSATELLDPAMISSHPLMGRLFTLIAFALFLALDLDHTLLRFLYGTFQSFPFSQELAQTAIQGVTLLYQQALSFAALPLILLCAVIGLFAILSRFLPIFWIGFPLQLLVGIIAISSALYIFIPLVEKGFSSFSALFQNLFVNF